VSHRGREEAKHEAYGEFQRLDRDVGRCRNLRAGPFGPGHRRPMPGLRDRNGKELSGVAPPHH
jgi:hypothetical protein